MPEEMKPYNGTVESAVRWLESAGFKGDLSAFGAAVYDTDEALIDIKNRLLPELVKLERGDWEHVLDVVVDMITQFEHIRQHMQDAIACLIEVRDFIDRSDC